MNNASLVLIAMLLLCAVFSLAGRLIVGAQASWRAPLGWFYSFWLLGTLLLALPIFHYSEEFSPGGFGYLMAVLTAYSIGDMVASFIHASRVRRVDHRVEKKRVIERARLERVLFVVIVLATLGIFLLIANSVLGSGLGIGDRLNLENAKMVRAAQMSGDESHIGPLFGPATLISAMGGVAVSFVMFVQGYGNGKLSARVRFAAYTWIGVWAFAGMIMFGSRMSALFAIMLPLFGYSEGRWAAGRRFQWGAVAGRTWKLLLVAPFVLALMWFSATYFLEKRVGGQDAERLLFSTHRAYLTADAHAAVSDSTTTKYFLLSLSYFSTPLPTLEFYLDLPDSRAPGPLWGEYDFPAVARWIRRFTFNDDPTAWDEARLEVFRPLSDFGYGTNVWATLARDLVADFGRLGAVLSFMLLGYMAQSLYLRQSRDVAPQAAILSVYLRIIVIFSGLVSVIYLPIIQWGLLAAILAQFFLRRLDTSNLIERAR